MQTHTYTHTLSPGALEELWKARPEAGLDDLEDGGGGGEGGKADELMPVALRYNDAAQYQVGARCNDLPGCAYEALCLL